jgi:hypothetical protein
VEVVVEGPLIVVVVGPLIVVVVGAPPWLVAPVPVPVRAPPSPPSGSNPGGGGSDEHATITRRPSAKPLPRSIGDGAYRLPWNPSSSSVRAP